MSILPETLNNIRQNLTDNPTKESAWKIITEYFSFFELDEVKDELWVLTAGALGNDDIRQTQKGIDRNDLIFFYEYTKMFFEAVDLLHNKRKKKYVCRSTE